MGFYARARDRTGDLKYNKRLTNHSAGSNDYKYRDHDSCSTHHNRFDHLTPRHLSSSSPRRKPHPLLTGEPPHRHHIAGTRRRQPPPVAGAGEDDRVNLLCNDTWNNPHILFPRNTQRTPRLNDQENKNQARMDIRNPLSIFDYC
ncbi:uncharacterized protein LOC110921931 [Helianthus annuus]|uniref:uncharacterized protein LOC110921959 n=1 Tax=Helianthus annuus TaxID=4232 RepID=UPI001652C76A|nr:uncharacterized protein LOC110921959 [Helianthus annuus]XP_035842140.1 uncharacterized protein LOC110921931 [Helianthus annuus]